MVLEEKNVSSSNKPKTQILENKDDTDPYYIHPSDHPGLVLVKQPLDGDNYGNWSRAMMISLIAKTKLGFVDGTIKAPPLTDVKYPLWKRCNNMILSWILNSINQDLADSVIYSETAEEVWADLEERFSQGNASRVFQIKREIIEHRQHQQSINAYYTKLKALWDELRSYRNPPSCTCGAMKTIAEYEAEDKVMQFLMGLNDSLSAVRGQILLMEPLPTVRKVHSLLLQEEKQREVADTREGTPAHAMSVKRHMEANTSRSQDQKGKSLHCSYCDGTTHTVNRCFYLIGFPPGHKFHGKNVQPPNKNKRPAANNTQIDASKAVTTTKAPTDVSFTHEELQQIRALIRSNGKQSSCANVTGYSNEEDDWFGEGA